MTPSWSRTVANCSTVAQFAPLAGEASCAPSPASKSDTRRMPSSAGGAPCYYRFQCRTRLCCLLALPCRVGFSGPNATLRTTEERILQLTLQLGPARQNWVRETKARSPLAGIIESVTWGSLTLVHSCSSASAPLPCRQSWDVRNREARLRSLTAVVVAYSHGSTPRRCPCPSPQKALPN